MRDWRDSQMGAPEFESEEAAVRLCFDALRPFCLRLVRDPIIDGGLKPDIGFRLKALPDVPLLLEVKPFGTEGFGTTLAEAIAQASDYADRMKTKAFVGPLYGRKATDLHWQDNPAGAMCLVGAQFNVGALLTAGDGEQRIVVLLLAQAPVATLTFNDHGEPSTKLHSDALHLLGYKDRAGSASWRKA